jgi:murein DD-endopeptidase MepM/ murein hydrolase activator NlpD
MFLLSNIQTVFLGIVSLLMPLSFSGLENDFNSNCHIEILEVKPQAVTYLVTNSFSQEINREDHHLLHEMGWPVIDPVVSSGWGNRESSCKACSAYHQGVDFTPGRGTPVMAAMRGTIHTVENSGAYGVHVIIEHDLHSQIWHTVYAHLKKNSVPKNIKPGTYVNIGDIVGSVGSTGISTGPHLHFEIRIDGIKVNPLPILKKNVSE